MALPPRNPNEPYPDYVLRIAQQGVIQPQLADRLLSIYKQAPRYTPNEPAPNFQMDEFRPAGPSAVSGDDPSVRVFQTFADALTPEERKQIGAEMYDEEFGYVPNAPTPSNMIVGADPFASRRGVNRFQQGRYAQSVGFPFPHQQRIPDPQPRQPIQQETPEPDLRSVDEVLASREEVPLSLEPGVPGTPRQVRATNADKAIDSLEDAIRRLESRKGSMTKRAYETRLSQLTGRLERARQRLAAATSGESAQEQRDARARARQQRQEEVRAELARRSIARRIRRGADPTSLIGRHNQGGARRGRYLDPAEFGYRRPAAAAAADGSVVDTDSGKRRVQTDQAGERAEVPVFETFQGEHVIDPSGLSDEEFMQFYTPGDRQRTAELIYATNSDLASRQRSIDAARNAAALDDYLNDEDRQNAMAQIDADEARLHRQFLISNAALVSNRGVSRDEKKKDKTSSDQVMQSDLLEYVNAMREAEGEDPFPSFADMRSTLTPREYQEMLRRYRASQAEKETPADEIVPLPPRPSPGQQSANIYERLLAFMAREAGFDLSDPDDLKIVLENYFDDRGRVRPDRFSSLARGLERMVGTSGGEIDSLVEQMVEGLERVYVRIMETTSVGD